MADAVLSATLKMMFNKLLSPTTEEINLVLGFQQELNSLKESLAAARAFSWDAEQRQVTDKEVKQWIWTLKCLLFEVDNVLDELNYELLRRKVEIRSTQGKRRFGLLLSLFNTLAFRVRMVSRIRAVQRNLKTICDRAGDELRLKKDLKEGTAHGITMMPESRMTKSTRKDPVFVGRENETHEIIERLTNPSDEVVSVIPIVGMGGLGKTTLAQSIFDDQRIKRHFDKGIWVCVSEDFDVTTLFQSILESLTKSSAEGQSKDSLIKKVKKELEGKRYLLVLDDVWNESSDVWDDFIRPLTKIRTSTGNKILLTTRKEVVALISGPVCKPFSLAYLSDNHCWSILKARAFAGAEVPVELEAIGKEIAKECRGLPLAAKLIGGVLRNKGKDQWLSFLKSGLSDLDREENIILQILKLSFDHLPSLSVKKCFAYCAIFPKDYNIERQQLVQLWMAEGLLESRSGSEMVMEDIGNDFFSILLQNSLLQNVIKDEYGNVTHCKMHDLVHDLAQSISSSDSLSLDTDRVNDVSKFHYLSIKSFGAVADIFMKNRPKHLRTLFLECNVTDNMLSCLRFLRVLSMSGALIEDLPTSISNLIHVRYLDVSETKIRALPYSVCKLYNLQTLRLNSCNFLQKLPDEMKYLISLRHLHYYNTQDFQMPSEMGQLTCLQTLPFFNVGQHKGCGIEELGNLKNLRGKLEIRKLELVKDTAEAQQADILGKPYIYQLEFHWSRYREGDNNDEHVLAGLQPHPNLRSLTITNFMGDKFPSWLMKMTAHGESIRGFSGLENIMELRLIGCAKCDDIPTLGLLPHLRCLELNGLHSIRCIGPSFYGTHSFYMSAQSSAETMFFRSLQSLELRNMHSLEEWKGVDEALQLASDEVVVFPILEKLSIEHCPKLTSAPSHFPNLKELTLNGVNSDAPIASICMNTSTLRSLYIGYVLELRFLPEGLLHNNQHLASLTVHCCPNLMNTVSHMSRWTTSLQELEIFRCEKLSELPESLYDLQSLESLKIYNCPNLQLVPVPKSDQELRLLRNIDISSCDQLTNLPSELILSCISLEELGVSFCPNLISFPVDFLQSKMSSLSTLSIYECPNLTTMPKGIGSLNGLRELCLGPFAGSVNFDSFEDSLDGLQQLPFLQRVKLAGSPRWESLPHHLQHLTALRNLYLNEFGVEVLPDWLGNLISLKELQIHNCEKLGSLPSREAMQRLRNLRKLWIENCPLLANRCAQGSSVQSEWSKISHIPNIFIR